MNIYLNRENETTYMTNTVIISQMRQTLRENIDPKVLASSGRFFKEGEAAKVYAIRVKELYKIGKEYLRQIKELPKREIFEIDDILLLDKDDLVQKGCGWMLKATSEYHQKEVFDYVMSKKTVMPRTAFRYAIEKMPADLRAEAMKK